MLEVLSAAKTLFANLSPTGDWMPRPEERAPTRFEKRGARLGHGVWDLAFSADIAARALVAAEARELAPRCLQPRADHSR